MPALKSRKRLPSTSSMTHPRARRTTSGYTLVSDGLVTASSRAMTSRARGPGSSVVSAGANVSAVSWVGSPTMVMSISVPNPSSDCNICSMSGWPEDLDELERVLLTQHRGAAGRRVRRRPAGAGLVAHRRRAGRRVRRPAGQPAPRPRRPLAAGARARLLHDRLRRPRGQRPRRRRPPADRSRACCTTAPAASTWPGPSRSRVTTACATCCSGCSPRPTSRSPVAATRSSATPIWR